MKIEEWFKLDSEITHMIVVLGNKHMNEDMHKLDKLHSKLMFQFDSYKLKDANEEIDYYRELTKNIDHVKSKIVST